MPILPIVAEDVRGVLARPWQRSRPRLVRVAGWLALVVAVAVMLWRVGTDPLIRNLDGSRCDAASLVLAGLVFVAAQVLYTSRWYWLLKVARVPGSWAEVMRTGLTAQLLGTVALGSAGGDVYRIGFGGRSGTGHRASIVSAILADRIAGIYSLFCLAALATTLSPSEGRWRATLAGSVAVLWIAVIAGGGLFGAVLLCGRDRVLRVIDPPSPLGRAVIPVLAAIRQFRSVPQVFGASVAKGIVVHAANAAGLWLVARGLGVPHPSLLKHFVIGPLATCTSLLPIPMGALGAVEVVVDELYQTATPAAAGAGLVAALGARALAVGVNAILAVAFAWIAMVFSPRPTHRQETESLAAP